MDKNWAIKSQGDEELVASLSMELTIDKPLTQLLIQRGVKTFEEARSFFRPNLDELYDPFLMKDMDRAIERINEAIHSGEKVMIYGDYDVDGTTAVSLVYSYFKDSFKAIDYYIPDRYAEGYGISLKGIDQAKQEGYSLIIALDCGIKAVDKIKYALEKGIDFIICDHHNPGDTIPEASAVLDPKQEGCKYPYKDLSGCGVGFKLIQAFGIKAGLPKERAFNFLDLVVVSIASDIVPITGENRIMAHYGLKRLNESPSIGLRAICDVAEIGRKEITLEEIVYKIGPRINAAGRMESGRKSVDLLVCEKRKEARIISQKINNFNLDRRSIDTEITKQAIEMIDNDVKLQEKSSTVLYNATWHKGVIGIVASRLMDNYYRPTVILTKSNGFATGSARSVNGFDLYHAIESCSDLLENFGGHKYAAGLTMKVDNLDEFTKRFEKIVSDTIDPEQLIPVLEIDTELQLKQINEKFFRILKQFHPFGPENNRPIFLMENVEDRGDARPVGAGNDHLKLGLIQEDCNFQAMPAIAFHQGKSINQIRQGKPFDICFQLMENEFRGKVSLQVNILDIDFD